MIELASKGFLLSLSLCLDLGIVNVALIRSALRDGVRPALALGLGSALGDLVYAFLSLSALAVLLEIRAVRVALWLGGTLVLAWLALRMLRETWRTRTPIGPADDAPRGSFLRGLMLALASPSAILWFAAVGGSVIASSASGPGAVLPFMAGFAAAGIAWALVIALAVGRAGRALGARTLSVASLCASALFVYFAVEVFTRGYTEFVLEAGA